MDVDLTGSELIELYISADCYISPYIAEGFNMPALEAAACGLPVIATRGGPTDDFLPEESCLSLPSELINVQKNDTRKALVHDESKLVNLMEYVITHPRLQKIALTLGSAKVHKLYSWEMISKLHMDYFNENV